MFAEKFEEFGQMKADAFIETATRTQMRERDPRVLRVPNNRGHGTSREDNERRIQTGPSKLVAPPRSKREDEQDRHELERVGVLAQKPEPDEQAGKRPPPRKVRTAFE